jgi:plasmid stabilization system protein ParE
MPDHRVVWTETARLDLEGIVGFIAADGTEQALRTLDRIEQRCQTLERLPDRGRIVPELSAVGALSYREVIERPWRIVYRVERQRVYVIAVLHIRRNLATLLLERLAR